MDMISKVIVLSILGGIVGFLLWLAFYLLRKTPAIEFDGPAVGGIIAATFCGMIVFGLIGAILVIRKRS